MANSKVVTWQGGSRSAAGAGSSKFLLKQSREPFGSIPKTNYAFQQWIIEEGYIAALANNQIDSIILYNQLKDQFFGKCGGGNGDLLFGVQVVRKDRTALPTQKSMKVFPTWGYLKFRGTKEVEETIFVKVDNVDEVTVNDYFITQIPRSDWVGIMVNGQWSYVGYQPGKWTEGGAYNSDGERVTRTSDLVATPDLDASGNLKLTFTQRLVGTYKLIIAHEFDDYVLTNPPHDLGISQDIFDVNKVYASTILGFGGGDYATMDMDIPDDAKDCIPYAEIIDPETGNTVTVIKNTETHLGYDADGDGYLDGGAEFADDCVCWMCGGTGDLPDCFETVAIDCTCPNCQGTGILPACQDSEESETNNNYYFYYNNKSDEDDDDGDGKPYTLEVDLHKCTGQVVDYNIRKN